MIGLDGEPILNVVDARVLATFEQRPDAGEDPRKGKFGQLIAFARDGQRLAALAREQQQRIRTLESSLAATMALVPTADDGRRTVIDAARAAVKARRHYAAVALRLPQVDDGLSAGLAATDAEIAAFRENDEAFEALAAAVANLPATPLGAEGGDHAR